MKSSSFPCGPLPPESHCSVAPVVPQSRYQFVLQPHPAFPALDSYVTTEPRSVFAGTGCSVSVLVFCIFLLGLVVDLLYLFIS